MNKTEVTDIVNFILSLPDTLKTPNSQEEQFWWDSYNKENSQSTYEMEAELNQQPNTKVNQLTDQEKPKRQMSQLMPKKTISYSTAEFPRSIKEQRN